MPHRGGRCCGRLPILALAPYPTRKTRWWWPFGSLDNWIVVPGCLPGYIVVEFHVSTRCGPWDCELTNPYSLAYDDIPTSLLVPRVRNHAINWPCQYCKAWGPEYCQSVGSPQPPVLCPCPYEINGEPQPCYEGCLQCPDDWPPADPDCEAGNGGHDFCFGNWVKVDFQDMPETRDVLLVSIDAHCRYDLVSYDAGCNVRHCHDIGGHRYFQAIGEPISALKFCQGLPQQVPNRMPHLSCRRGLPATVPTATVRAVILGPPP